MTTWQSGIPEKSWDDLLYKKDGHFMQSSAWAAAQSALGRPVFYAKGSGWQSVAFLEQGQLGTRIYCPYPLIASVASLDLALSSLKHLAKQQNVSYVRIELDAKIPAKILQVRGLRRSPKDVQPRYTWVKDLTKPKTELLSEMTSTNRNLYNTAAKKGLKFTVSRSIGDLPIFLDMIHEVSKHTGMKPFGDNYYQAVMGALLQNSAAKIYIASYKNKPVASALVYDSPTTRYYTHAASYHDARKLHPGSPLLSTMIFDAKRQGQNEFDFFGIAPPNSKNHRWSGFTHFKQSFGGKIKEYSGTWELPTKPLHYTAYRIAHTAKGLLK